MNSACMIPLVVANERGQSPNLYCVCIGDKGVFAILGVERVGLQFPNKTDPNCVNYNRKLLERSTKDGDSPVDEILSK